MQGLKKISLDCCLCTIRVIDIFVALTSRARRREYTLQVPLQSEQA